MLCYQFSSIQEEWMLSLCCNFFRLCYSSSVRSKRALDYHPIHKQCHIRTYSFAKLYYENGQTFHLIKQDSISIKIVIQCPSLTAAVLQRLGQIQGHSQPHCPFHRLVFPCSDLPHQFLLEKLNKFMQSCKSGMEIWILNLQSKSSNKFTPFVILSNPP